MVSDKGKYRSGGYLTSFISNADLFSFGKSSFNLIRDGDFFFPQKNIEFLSKLITAKSEEDADKQTGIDSEAG